MPRSQDVVDYIAYMEHLDWIMSMCDNVFTANSIFKCFKSPNMSSVHRGANVMDRDQISTIDGSTGLDRITMLWEEVDPDDPRGVINFSGVTLLTIPPSPQADIDLALDNHPGF